MFLFFSLLVSVPAVPQYEPEPEPEPVPLPVSPRANGAAPTQGRAPPALPSLPPVAKTSVVKKEWAVKAIDSKQKKGPKVMLQVGIHVPFSFSFSIILLSLL